MAAFPGPLRTQSRTSLTELGLASRVHGGLEGRHATRTNAESVTINRSSLIDPQP